MIRITIHDQGIGMDRDTIDRLFKPFEQHDQPGGLRSGLGLGLTICDSIISEHGGRLWASSEGIGHGSTFEIELASCEVPAGAGYRSTEGPREMVAGNGRPADANARRRALIVEDHHHNGTLMSMFLSQQGYDVTLSQTLADGLEQLDREWDVVLADIGLGDGSGLEVARRGRSLSRPPGRMVALSGSDRPLISPRVTRPASTSIS